jgi:hypothetical protein
MAEITNKLLKQAIADAEAVRETAVANAKLVLEEAIAPHIREMIARRLRVEADMTQEETTDEAKELPFEDGEAEGSSEMPADSSTVGSGENKEPSDDSFDASGIGDGGENKEDSHTDWYDDWSESDFDLDEVIKELEEDIANLGEGGEDEEEGHDEEEEKDEEDEESKDEAYPKKEMTHAPELKKVPVAPVAEKKHDEEGDEEEHDKEEKDDEDVNLEAILAELDDDEDEMGDDMMSRGDHTKEEGLQTQLAGLRKELAQYHAVVNTLRERLQEVNLLNAKLLFTNKMFRNQGLNNEQKVRIVESFDRATTVREVKLVYTALVENLSTAAKTFNASRKKVVAEGFASKATPTTAPKAQTVIVENTVAKRLQELAGIIS